MKIIGLNFTTLKYLRNSPSVIARIPTCFCIATTLLMALSSTTARSSSVHLPSWYSALLRSKSAGLFREPICSARNGGWRWRLIELSVCRYCYTAGIAYCSYTARSSCLVLFYTSCCFVRSKHVKPQKRELFPTFSHWRPGVSWSVRQDWHIYMSGGRHCLMDYNIFKFGASMCSFLILIVKWTGSTFNCVSLRWVGLLPSPRQRPPQIIGSV